MIDTPEICLFGLNFNSVALEQAAEHLSSIEKEVSRRKGFLFSGAFLYAMFYLRNTMP
ncbi:MAG: hypothetical protein ACYCR5_10520 [Leptospirillum sp.]